MTAHVIVEQESADGLFPTYRLAPDRFYDALTSEMEQIGVEWNQATAGGVSTTITPEEISQLSAGALASRYPGVRYVLVGHVTIGVSEKDDIFTGSTAVEIQIIDLSKNGVVEIIYSRAIPAEGGPRGIDAAADLAADRAYDEFVRTITPQIRTRLLDFFTPAVEGETDTLRPPAGSEDGVREVGPPLPADPDYLGPVVWRGNTRLVPPPAGPDSESRSSVDPMLRPEMNVGVWPGAPNMVGYFHPLASNTVTGTGFRADLVFAFGVGDLDLLNQGDRYQASGMRYQTLLQLTIGLGSAFEFHVSLPFRGRTDQEIITFNGNATTLASTGFALSEPVFEMRWMPPIETDSFVRGMVVALNVKMPLKPGGDGVRTNAADITLLAGIDFGPMTDAAVWNLNVTAGFMIGHATGVGPFFGSPPRPREGVFGSLSFTYLLVDNDGFRLALLVQTQGYVLPPQTVGQQFDRFDIDGVIGVRALFSGSWEIGLSAFIAPTLSSLFGGTLRIGYNF